ncbi:tetratricopeptide repeat protein [Hyalangium rubrum]|uniref:Tetratricopeptide repeat protein n=1 Tax=Hyalangium rubrum TaxID=3103134 RepID=A0ABU5HAM8_9BACT|nr:tetratricopeptide repeat protein [Hyalangium sp. s54d21]MDY7230525.1 tetratricopeptide repeat protein [Hyalangium sp. s54d21]
MKTKARALHPHLLPALLPILAVLGIAGYEGLLALRPSRPTSSDMAAAKAVTSAPPSLSLPVESTPATEEGLPPSDELSLAHEHLSRINHLARARTLGELGDFAGALTECRRALHDTPEDEETLRALARLAQLTEQPELAVHAFERLGRLRPDDASPLVQQARLLITLGRYADAARAGEAALLRDSEEPEAYHVIGRAHLAAGNLPEALPRLEQAVHLAPEHGHALNNLGLAYLRSSQDAKAAEVLARAAARLPHVAYVHNNLGVAYERLGRAEEAQAAYAAATRLSPRYVKARLNGDRVNKVARLDVPPPGPRDGLAPGQPSEDTGP